MGTTCKQSVAEGGAGGCEIRDEQKWVKPDEARRQDGGRRNVKKEERREERRGEEADLSLGVDGGRNAAAAPDMYKKRGGQLTALRYNVYRLRARRRKAAMG